MKTTLRDEITDIMDNAIKEILERSEGHKSAMKYLIEGICNMCVIALTNTKYSKDEKITSVKKWADHYVNGIDQAIEDFSHCTRNQ